MMRKRFVPPLQSSFGKTRDTVDSMSNWVSNNKLLSFVALLAVTAFAIAIAAYFHEGFRDQLTDLFSNITGKKKSIKELDVLFFMSPTCDWCKKMINVMKDDGTITDVTVIDVTKPEGQELAKKFGADKRGIPNFISRKLNTGTVGLKNSTQKIIDALTSVKNPGSTAEEGSEEGGSSQPAQTQTPVNPEEVQNLGVVLFFTEGCEWCNKAKSEAEGLGILPFLELQDVNSPDGQAVLQSTGIDFKGAPTFYSRSTGKSAVGYKPYDQIITMLSN